MRLPRIDRARGGGRAGARGRLRQRRVDDPDPGRDGRASPPAPPWPSCSPPRRSPSAPSSTSRCFGLKGLDGKPAGFDVEIGKIIAAELGIAADKIDVGGDPVGGPRGARSRRARSTSSSRPTRSTTSARSGSTSPGRTTSPARTSWSRPTTPPSPARSRSRTAQEGLLGEGSTPAANIEKYLKDKAHPAGARSTRTPSASTRSRAARSTRSPPTT